MGYETSPWAFLPFDSGGFALSLSSMHVASLVLCLNPLSSVLSSAVPVAVVVAVSSLAIVSYTQGGILQDNFEEEKAIQCFHRTIEIDPDYADAHYK